MRRHAARVCAEPGCPRLAVKGGRCLAHAGQQRRQDEADRPSRQQRGYDRQWEQDRADYLAAHPFCVGVLVPLPGGGWLRKHADGCDRVARIVDHIVPRARGGSNTWANYQPLSRPCHSMKTAQLDGGFGNRRQAAGA